MFYHPFPSFQIFFVFARSCSFVSSLLSRLFCFVSSLRLRMHAGAQRDFVYVTSNVFPACATWREGRTMWPGACAMYPGPMEYGTVLSAYVDLRMSMSFGINVLYRWITFLRYWWLILWSYNWCIWVELWLVPCQFFVSSLLFSVSYSLNFFFVSSFPSSYLTRWFVLVAVNFVVIRHGERCFWRFKSSHRTASRLH